MTTGNYDRNAEIERIQQDWVTNPRWKGVARTYSAADVVRLRGSIRSRTPSPGAAPKSSGS